MSSQQYELCKHFKRKYTYAKISELTGIQKTRVFRIMSNISEMKLGEYLSLLAIYKNEAIWDINKAFFFLGVE